MAKGLGNNYRVFIGDGQQTEAFHEIKGQGDLKRGGSVDKVDLSTKDTAGYKTSAPGLRDLTLTLDVIPDLPDVTGYTRAESVALAAVAAPINVEVRKNGSAGVEADAVFKASMYVAITSGDFSQNQGAKVTFEFTLASTPTVDVLAV